MKMTVIAGTVLLNGIVALYAEPVSNGVGVVVEGEQKTANQPTRTAQLIVELNSVATNFFVNGDPGTHRLTGTNRLTTGESLLRLGSSNLKWDLAEQGVTIRYVDGRYVDATTNAENGHALSKEDRRALAELNFFEQTRGLGLHAILGERRGGIHHETRDRILYYKEQLEDRRISVSWDRTNEFYFVTSTQAPPVKATRRPGGIRVPLR
jgi:hypothetical protein